jgi:hypothetical protein
MAKYKITFTETLVYETEIEAKNEQEAKEIFYQSPFENLDIGNPIDSMSTEILSIEVE